MATSNGGEQADDFKLERLRRLTAHGRNDIGRQGSSLADSMLRGGRIEFPWIQRIGHEGAVAQRPHAGPARHLETIVRDHATALYRARQTGQQRRRRDARGPDEHTGGDFRPIIKPAFLASLPGTLVWRRISAPRWPSRSWAYRPQLIPNSGRMWSPGSTTTTRSILSFKLG